ncbi:MAG TPA: Trk family potassium uptake protein [Candidatus Avidehalobacter gallistercoris]|uniref:Trk family potassium uptake protein n=1 Tax=Candidatus Avidehalobacter gallistercoris TaxID=2840694 RepID=A0A9D1HMD2_9FIRM|nr:Trk family potassium uptake protein [Candidatus Avidehalobacter gallistercoris]
MAKLRRKLTSSQMIILGFAAVILLGALLLMLPVSSKNGEITPFIDCLLTSTSAVCVTGLVVYDTAAHWTPFGQAVIIVMIQIGGMGVITVAAAITMMAGKKISLMQRITMQDAISAPQVGGIVRFTGFILKGIVIIELLGAAIMAPVFIRDYGVGAGLWMAVFHSISAFCNAGFDIVDDGTLFNSLMGYAADPIINLIIMLMIIIGGLGFLTWHDIYSNGIHVKQYRMQSKVILTVTAGLIMIPTVYFFFFELAHLPFAERFWGALFQAVTPRTAGFNTIDLNSTSETGQMLTSLLMIIGGAPGSTAGGMKVTTFAVMVSAASAVFHRRQNGQFFGRRIDDDTVKNAAAVFLMYVSLFLLGGMTISKLENIPLMDCLYESASAVGTVGLSLGITPELGAVSKLILIAQMYIGRVGGLTLIYATLPATKNTLSKLPVEKISVG